MQLTKAAIGIQGLDELTGSGLPQGCSTLICGGADGDKTLLSMVFLGHGAEVLSDPISFKNIRRDGEPAGRGIMSDSPVLDNDQWLLRLYVAGQTPRSLRAVVNIQKICAEHLQGRYQLEVIDLYQQPHLAQGQQIVAVPTLIKRLPAPLRTVIGDLSDTERVLIGLDLRSH